MYSTESESLFTAAYRIILETDAAKKQQQVSQLQNDWLQERLTLQPVPVMPILEPGYPAGLKFVAPRQLKSRKLGSLAGRQAFIHALMHIEFNAINLALDAVYRFQTLPSAYYTDWLNVAVEEADHFRQLQDRLKTLGKRYGDFPVHDGLWIMALSTADSILLRLAMVPRGLEARGLDVTPAMIERLYAANDPETAQILERIFADEITHVQAGSRWFRYVCEQQGLSPDAQFIKIMAQFPERWPSPPLAETARLSAGFTAQELAGLAALIHSPAPINPVS